MRVGTNYEITRETMRGKRRWCSQREGEKGQAIQRDIKKEAIDGNGQQEDVGVGKHTAEKNRTKYPNEWKFFVGQ